MKALVVTLIVLIVLLIAGGVYTFGFYLPRKIASFDGGPPPIYSPTGVPKPSQTVSLPTPSTTSRPTSTPTASPSTPAASPFAPVAPTVLPSTLAPTANPTPGGQFDISIASITGSGLSRTVTAQIKNTGARDIHNAWIKLEAFSQGARVSLNNSDYLRVDIGTLPSGTTVTKQADLQIGFMDGLRIAQNGAQFVLTITSDEATQTSNYDFKP